jgi:hypothetical protein
MMPLYFAGLEVGWREVALVGEFSKQTHIPSIDSIYSLQVGLNFAIGK